MQSTLPKAMLLTLAIAHLSSPQEVKFSNAPIRERLTTNATISAQFASTYRFLDVSDGTNMVEFVTMESPPARVDEILAMSELVEIGTILFKDSRDVSSYEVEMMRAYIAKKYTEV